MSLGSFEIEIDLEEAVGGGRWAAAWSRKDQLVLPTSTTGDRKQSEMQFQITANASKRHVVAVWPPSRGPDDDPRVDFPWVPYRSVRGSNKTQIPASFNMEVHGAARETRLSARGHDRALVARTIVAIRRDVCSWSDLRCSIATDGGQTAPESG